MRWRLIELNTYNAAMNMAIDEAISESVKEGKSLPTIRFYKWSPSAVSIGCFQSMNDEIDIKRCKDLGIDLVRRRTGGGAVYHDDNGEITYSVIAPHDMLPDITKSYHVICGWIVDALKHLGIGSEFKPINDVITDGKKISGNAQTRRGGVILQHGTILYKVDVEKMFSLLKVPDEKYRDKLILNVRDRVTSVYDIKEVSSEEVYEAMVKGFMQGKEYDKGFLSEEEIKRAEELAKERYSCDEWNFER